MVEIKKKKWFEEKFAKTCICMMLITISSVFILQNIIIGKETYDHNWGVILTSHIIVFLCSFITMLLLISIHKHISPDKTLFKTKILIEIIAEAIISIIEGIVLFISCAYSFQLNELLIEVFLLLKLFVLPLDIIAIFFTSVALLNKISE